MEIVFVLAAALAISLPSSLAHNTVCLSGNKFIQKVYVDGVDYTNHLPNRANPFQCDCFGIPADAGTIAVKAKAPNFQLNKAGILMCETDDHGVYSDWICANAVDVKGKWYLPGKLTGNKIWKQATSSDCQRNCRGKKGLPCHTNHCIWSPDHGVSSVNCIKKKCADGCSSCSRAGPGKCDPGKCIYGESLDQLNQVTACNRTCKLEVQAWNITGTGFIKLTDQKTRTVSKYTANVAGAYLATVDMSTCSLTNLQYNTWADESVHSNLLNYDWSVSSNTAMLNIVGIELGVGYNVNDPKNYAPWIAVYGLGKGSGNVLDNINNHTTTLSATITGVNHGVVTLDNIVLE